MIEAWSEDPTFMADQLQAVNLCDGKATVRLRNTTDAPRTVKQGLQLGTFRRDKSRLCTIAPTLLIHTTKDDIVAIVEKARKDHPSSTKEIDAWFLEATEAQANRPKSAQELKNVIL